MLQMVKGWDVKACRFGVRKRRNMCWDGFQLSLLDGIEIFIMPPARFVMVARRESPWPM